MTTARSSTRCATGSSRLFLGVDRVAADLEADIRAFDAERQEFVDGLRDGGTVADTTGRPATGEAASGRAGGASVHGGPRPRNAALTDLASRHACFARSASGVTDP